MESEFRLSRTDCSFRRSNICSNICLKSLFKYLLAPGGFPVQPVRRLWAGWGPKASSSLLPPGGSTYPQVLSSSSSWPPWPWPSLSSVKTSGSTMTIDMIPGRVLSSTTQERLNLSTHPARAYRSTREGWPTASSMSSLHHLHLPHRHKRPHDHDHHHHHI